MNASALRAALDALPVGFALFDADGRLAASNARLADLKLFPKRLLKQSTAMSALRAIDAGLQRRVSRPRELQLPKGVALRVTTSRVPPGHLLVTYEDITAQKSAATALGRARTEASDAIERQTATSEVLRVMSSSPSDLRPVFETILSRAIRLCEGNIAVLWRFDGSHLRVTAHKNASAPGLAYMEAHPLVLGTYNPTPRAALERRIVHELDVFSDTEYRPLIPRGAATGSAQSSTQIAVPLLTEDEVLGVITIWRFEKKPFSEKQVSLLSTFADQAVIAIENVRLFNETKEALERQTATAEILHVISSTSTDTQPVFDAIVASTQRLMAGKSTVLLIRRDPHFIAVAYAGPAITDLPEDVRVAPLDRNKNFPSRAILDAEVVHIPNWDGDDIPEHERNVGKAFGIKAGLMVPLLREGQGIGALAVTRGTPGPYDEKEVALLQSFADQAVIAIENARLFNETKEALERQTATAEILKVISGSPTDVQPVFDTIVRNAVELSDALFSAVYRFDGERLHLVAHHNYTPDVLALENRLYPMRPERGQAVGRAILDRTLVHIQDALTDADYQHDIAQTGGWRSMIAVPMFCEQTPVGVIWVARAQTGPFSDHQIELLETFADQAVIAIENVRLFKELEARNREVTEALERQTATAEILRVISESPTDTQPVFDAIVQSGLKLFPGALVSVALRYGDTINAAAVAAPDPARVEAWRRTISGTPLARNYMHGAALLDRRIVDIPDVADAPAEFVAGSQNFLTSGNRAITIMPLMRGDEAIGLLSVVRRVAGPLSDRQLGLLRTFADQAVIAIENVRLFNETKEALERQTATADILKVIASSPSDVQPVFDAIVQSAVRLCDAVYSAAITLDGGLLHIAGMHNWPAEGLAVAQRLFPMPLDSDHLTAIAVRENRVIHRDHLQDDPDVPATSRELAIATGYQSLMIVPMVREGRSQGAIVVTRKSAFSNNQIALLQTFADQAVIAIENVRLFNETKEALEQQKASAEVLGVISNSISDAQPVFDKIVESCARLFGESRVGLNVIGDDGMVYAGAYGPFPEAETFKRENFPHPATTESATGAAIHARHVVHYPDVFGDPDVPEYARRGCEKMGFRSTIIAPLLAEDRGLGSIFVGRGVVRPFTDKEMALLNTFSNQAVIAIQNARLFNETKEALEQQTATAEVLQVISRSTFDLQPVFDTLVENAARLCGAQTGMIFQRDGTLMRLAAAYGASDRFVEFVEKNNILVDRSSVTGRSALDARTTHVVDVMSDPEYGYGGQPLENYRTIVGVPLLRDGQAVGVFTLWRHQVAAFTPRQIALVETFADQAVIAIENVRLFNETKEALERQTATAEILRVISSSPTDTQPVFEAIVRGAMRLFGGLSAGVMMVRGDRIEVAAIAATPEGERVRDLFPLPLTRESNTGRTILDRQAQVVPDSQALEMPEYAREIARKSGVGAYLSAPMLREGAAIGAIVLFLSERRAFDSKQVALLQTFADQAVIAIENVRLFNETKEALERQTATAEVLQVISRSPDDVQPVLDAVVSRAARICDSDDAVLFVLESDQFWRRARFQLVPDALTIGSAGTTIALDRSTLMGAAVLDRAPVQVEDLQNPPAGMYEYGRKRATNMNHRTTLAVPLLRENTALGAILLRRKEIRPFSDKQIALLGTFADQAVIAIENVRLFKELQSRTEALTRSVGQLTALGEVGQAISSTLDLETVLKTIVSNAMRLSGLDAGVIYEYDVATEQFQVRASENLDAESVANFRGAELRVGEGAVGSSVSARTPQQVTDTHAPDYPPRLRALLDRPGFRAALAVPLLREEQIIGALLMLRRTPGPFAADIVDMLKTFASQSALAIQNARLFREIEDKGLQLEEASHHKSQFLASMSHELRTPLNAILGFNEMILGEVYGEVPTDMKEPLDDIQTSGKHLLRLINNVLDLAKIEAGRMELSLADYAVQDMVESVRATLRPLAEAKGLEFLASVPNEIPLAYGDFGRLTQCLMNLAGNSLKFTKSGSVGISVEQNGATLIYRVTDTGIGIPPDKIDSLFTEFKQTDASIASEYGGTGLGLSITKQFIEMHGGRIWVESVLGEGSTFIFELPLRLEPGATA